MTFLGWRSKLHGRLVVDLANAIKGVERNSLEEKEQVESKNKVRNDWPDKQGLDRIKK
jgi:hypothetical protein